MFLDDKSSQTNSGLRVETRWRPSKYFMNILFQVDYKRLSEDLSKIVDMRGTNSSTEFRCQFYIQCTCRSVSGFI